MKCFLILCVSFIRTLYAQEALKLPDSVQPEHYNIRILTLLHESQFEGTVDILVKCYMDTKVITLHAAEMTIVQDKISVKDSQTAVEQKITGIEMVDKAEFLKINMQNVLLNNQKYMVHIEFLGKLQDADPLGYHINTYVDEQGTNRSIVNTHFEPTWARNAFPCFDLPHMKATFEVTIGRNEKYFSLNNMPLAKTEPIKGRDGWFWDHFEKTPRMSTYLVAFAVLDDGMKNISSGKITFWFSPGVMIDSDLARSSKVILEFLEHYFGMEYELPKLDILAVNNYPPFAGACETWGLILANAEAFYHIDYAQEIPILIISHEFVHQWIGNIITMKCFGELWLKEGITSRITAIAKDNVLGGQTLDMDTATSFIGTMSDYSSDELSADYCPEILKDILLQYKPSTYEKGGLLIRMLEMTLGMKDFKKTINFLLTKHKFQNIDESDLWVALKETANNFPSHLHMDVIWSSWTKQSGFPLVDVTRNYKNGTATLTQSKFYDVDAKDETTCWWIPVSYTTKSDVHTNNAVAKSWMNCPKEPLLITNLKSSDWILTNLQSSGLYIVKYDHNNWELLSETLRDKQSFEVIPYWNRFKLVLDSFFLTDRGLLSHESLLTTLLYLKHETNHIVWKAALKYLDKIDWLEGEVVKLKKEYVKKLIKPHFSKRLFKMKESSLKEKQFYKEIIHQACYAGDEECIGESLRLFDEFMKSYPQESSMDKDIRVEVFCIALKFGPEQNLLFLLESSAAEVDMILKGQMLYIAITCGNITMPEQKKRTPIGRHASLESINEGNYEAIFSLIEKHPVFAEILLTRFIDNQLHRPSELIDFKNFMEKIGLHNSKIAKKIVKGIEENIEWKKKYSNEIETALSKILRNDEKPNKKTSTTPRVPQRPGLKKPFFSNAHRFGNVNSYIFIYSFIYYF